MRNFQGILVMNGEVDIFLSQLKLRDTSDNTPKQYEYTLKMFQRFLGSDRDVKLIERQDIASFVEYLGKPSQKRLHKNAYKRSSIIAVRACLSSFFQYMMDAGRIDRNSMPGTSRLPRRPRNPIYLTEEEKDRMLKTAKTLEEKLILNFLIPTGMRMGELLGVRVRDLDLEGGRVQVKLKRGALRQYIIISALVEEDMGILVREYVEKMKLGQEDKLIGLSRRALQYSVERVAKRAGITKKLSPHKLRHTFAISLRRRGLRTVDL
jgi:integrase/recombinase XerD